MIHSVKYSAYHAQNLCDLVVRIAGIHAGSPSFSLSMGTVLYVADNIYAVIKSSIPSISYAPHLHSRNHGEPDSLHHKKRSNRCCACCFLYSVSQIIPLTDVLLIYLNTSFYPVYDFQKKQLLQVQRMKNGYFLRYSQTFLIIVGRSTCLLQRHFDFS